MQDLPPLEQNLNFLLQIFLAQGPDVLENNEKVTKVFSRVISLFSTGYIHSP